jgi:hypothetical protein
MEIDDYLKYCVGMQAYLAKIQQSEPGREDS